MSDTHTEMIARLRAERARLVERVAQVDAAIAALEPLAEVEHLQVGSEGVTFGNDMHSTQERQVTMGANLRAKHSAIKGAKSQSEHMAAFVEACSSDMARANGIASMSDVAHRIGKNPAALAQMLYGRKVTRPAVAKKVAKLIPYPADADHWPDLRGPGEKKQ